MTDMTVTLCQPDGGDGGVGLTSVPGLLHIDGQHPVGISLDEVRMVASPCGRHREATWHHLPRLHLGDGNSFRAGLVQ